MNGHTHLLQKLLLLICSISSVQGCQVCIPYSQITKAHQGLNQVGPNPMTHLDALTSAVSALAEQRQDRQSSTISGVLVGGFFDERNQSAASKPLGNSAYLGIATYAYCKWKGMSLIRPRLRDKQGV